MINKDQVMTRTRINKKQLNLLLHEAVHNSYFETVKKAIKDGADVNIKDEYGRTPLHNAASYGKTSIAKVLIESGANVNCIERKSEATPLHMTAWYGYFETAKILLENKANVNAKTAHGYTPLYLANLYNKTEIAELFKQHGGIE